MKTEKAFIEKTGKKAVFKILMPLPASDFTIGAGFGEFHESGNRRPEALRNIIMCLMGSTGCTP